MKKLLLLLVTVLLLTPTVFAETVTQPNHMQGIFSALDAAIIQKEVGTTSTLAGELDKSQTLNELTYSVSSDWEEKENTLENEKIYYTNDTNYLHIMYQTNENLSAYDTSNPEMAKAIFDGILVGIDADEIFTSFAEEINGNQGLFASYSKTINGVAHEFSMYSFLTDTTMYTVLTGEKGTLSDDIKEDLFKVFSTFILPERTNSATTQSSYNN